MRGPVAAGASAGLAAAAVVAAGVLQHAFDMQPCAWCVLQRLAALALVPLGLAGMMAAGWMGRVLCGLASVLVSVGGLCAASYQHLVAARTDACGLSLADRLIMFLNLHELAPWLFMPTARCDEANAPLLGVPFALWGAALFVATGLLSVMAAAAAWRARPAAAVVAPTLR
jgi:disulfide bond formation protein DsbB